MIHKSSHRYSLIVIYLKHYPKNIPDRKCDKGLSVFLTSLLGCPL